MKSVLEEAEKALRELPNGRIEQVKVMEPRGTKKWFKVVYVPPEVVPPDKPHVRAVVRLPDGRKALVIMPVSGDDGG